MIRRPTTRPRARPAAHGAARRAVRHAAVRSAARVAAALLGLSALAALSGCASPPAHFYTLTGERDVAPALPANPPFLIQLGSVDVPEQVAKKQFVVQKSPTELDVLEQQRWAALPSDEIHHALSLALARRLGTLDVGTTAYQSGKPVYRIGAQVGRFEMWPGERAVLEAVWSVHALDASAPVMTCRTLASERVGPGYDALVEGQRRALERLAAQIAAGVRALAAQGPHAGSAPPCPAGDAAPAIASGAAAAPTALPMPAVPAAQ